MKIVCIGMDDQGQYFVGQEPDDSTQDQQSQDPMSEPAGSVPEATPESYMQPVGSINEAFQAAQQMLMAGASQDGGQADFDAGVKRVLGPNPRPSMDNPRSMAPMPPRGPKGGM